MICTLLLKSIHTNMTCHLLFNKNMLLKQLKECEIVETTVDEGGDVISARKLKQGKGITVRFLY